ncbi:MAG: carboxyltransferase domain-containing protein [Paracoccus sp. (in: a-proteobacteria)]|nr:carboxyltransferase domain-containing protein [Paracoccus sp. (in: a-proteobacteria)]
MRVLPAGGRALLIELAGLDEVLALLASLHADPLPGVDDLIPAARTLALGYDPDVTGPGAILAALAARDLDSPPPETGREVEIPVIYDGADLDEVATLTGLTRTEVIARHTATPWRAAFSGFAPGFCYLTGGDPLLLSVPRRASPRPSVPAGSVALAGGFSAVYPRQSPGGWQLIGTSPVGMWDIDRAPPALLAPGDLVRFTRYAPRRASPKAAAPPPDPQPATAPPTQPPASLPAPLPGASAQPATLPPSPPQARLDILAAPFPALIQDGGRRGHAGQGVSVSGAADRGAWRALNRLLGNPSGTPALEIIGGGLRLRATAPCTLAMTGAPRRITGAGGPLASHTAFALNAGDEIEIGPPEAGVYGYLGARGGFSVQPVLGSAARDTLAGIGPAPLTEGGWLGLAGQRARPLGPPICAPDLPRPGDLVWLDAIMGPRDDWFSASARAGFLADEWRVTPQSSRIGKRLKGDRPLIRHQPRELPSEATTRGSIQIPHSGQPVLFLADPPLTGGYPVIATIAPHHLDLASQAPPGARLRFRPIPPPKGLPA